MNSQNLKASVSFVGDGTTNKFYFGFDYINKQFVKVQIGNEGQSLTYPSDYTVDDRSVVLKDTPAVGVAIRVYRETSSDRIVEWADGAFIKASQMTLENLQQLHLIEEAQDYPILNSLSKYPDGVHFNALDSRVVNVSDPQDAQDVVTKNYMENVQGSFVTANTKILNEAKDTLSATKQTQSKAQANENLSKAWAVSTESPDGAEDTQSSTGKTQSSRTWALLAIQSEQNAKTSETNAKASETKAKTSETNAKTSETNAKDSETKAKTSETNAKASETNAQTSASAAKTSETNAKTSETNAGTYAGNAQTSANAAKVSETNAKTSETNAEMQYQKVKNEAQGIVDGMPIGFEFIQMNPNVPLGSLPMLGGEYSRETFASLWAWVQEQTGYLITEAKWQELSQSNGGNVPFYSSGDGSTTFRVPSLQCWVKGADSIKGVGSYLQAGLPKFEATTSTDGEHTHPFQSQNDDMNASGASCESGYRGFVDDSVATWKQWTDMVLPAGAHTHKVTLENDIYGKANTVQPQSLVGLWCVKAFGRINDLGNADATKLIENFRKELKEDIANNVPTPVTLWDAMHSYPRNYVPSDVSNAGWNKLGFCSIYYDTNVLNNQPSQYGQLINIPAIKDGNESTQLWIDQNYGCIRCRGGNDAIAVNDTPFKHIGIGADDHLHFPNGAELWVY